MGGRVVGDRVVDRSHRSLQAVDLGARVGTVGVWGPKSGVQVVVGQGHDHHSVALVDAAFERRVDRLAGVLVEGLCQHVIFPETSESLFVVPRVLGLVLHGHVGAGVVVVAHSAAVQVHPQGCFGVGVAGRIHHQEGVVACQAGRIGVVPIEIEFEAVAQKFFGEFIDELDLIRGALHDGNRGELTFITRLHGNCC